MWKLKNKIRGLVKKLYHKANPQYRYILHMNDMLVEIEKKINELKTADISTASSERSEIQKLFLAADYMNYRYLYLARYINENDKVLDIEAGYGTGVDLLAKYTAVDECICLNSIDYYTKVGAMYYQSDFVKFKTGWYETLDQKFNIITFFNEEKTAFLNSGSINILGNLVEYNGILALAFKQSFEGKTELIETLLKTGFGIEIRLYQNRTIPELSETETCNISEIIYLRKHA